MKTVKQILAVKGSDVYTIAPAILIVDAVKEMASRKVSALVVIDDSKVKGIITEQDFTRRVILKDLDPKKTKVDDVMTERITCVQPENTTNESMAIMTDKCVRHLPVLENGELVGLISIGDLVKEVISDQEFTISQLEQYIHN